MIATFTGVQMADVYIATGTNPWVEVDLRPIWWEHLHTEHETSAQNDCDTCAGCLIPGVIDGMDSEIGVQRCDTCALFPGDLEAAQALADRFGGQVRFEVEAL